MKNSRFMKITAIVFMFTTLSILSEKAYSQFYIGGGIGNSFVNKELRDISANNFTLNSNSFAYKVYAGYDDDFFGVEGGYRSLGTVEDEVSGATLQSKISGWDAAAKGRIELGPIFGFAKAGVFFASEENTVGAIGSQPLITKENSTNFLWGLGAGVKLGTVGIRAEFESLNVQTENRISMLSLGATFEM